MGKLGIPPIFAQVNVAAVKLLPPGGILGATFLPGAQRQEGRGAAQRTVVGFDAAQSLPTNAENERWTLEVDVQDALLQKQIANYDGETVQPFAHVPMSEDAKGNVTWKDMPLSLFEWPVQGGNDHTVKQYIAFSNDGNPPLALVKKYGVAFGIRQPREGGVDTYWLQDRNHNTRVQIFGQ